MLAHSVKRFGLIKEKGKGINHWKQNKITQFDFKYIYQTIFNLKKQHDCSVTYCSQNGLLIFQKDNWL